MPIITVPNPKTPPTIVFCFPGKSFSNNFLTSWSDVLYSCIKNGITPILATAYDPIVYYARNKVLGGNVLRGIKQKPFGGTTRYDFLMWIDSDIVFNFDQVLRLIKRNVSVVSGVYLMADNTHYATVKDWDTTYFAQHGSFQFLTPADMTEDLTEVAYSGLGFMLIKYGVFESLEYPWFRPVFQQISDDIYDFSAEDVSLCQALREKGHKIYVDPTVRVGHEKSRIL
jgi:hypothetical protein